jgi:hypothetical protein
VGVRALPLGGKANVQIHFAVGVSRRAQRVVTHRIVCPLAAHITQLVGCTCSSPNGAALRHSDFVGFCMAHAKLKRHR